MCSIENKMASIFFTESNLSKKPEIERLQNTLESKVNRIFFYKLVVDYHIPEIFHFT